MTLLCIKLSILSKLINLFTARTLFETSSSLFKQDWQCPSSTTLKLLTHVSYRIVVFMIMKIWTGLKEHGSFLTHNVSLNFMQSNPSKCQVKYFRMKMTVVWQLSFIHELWPVAQDFQSPWSSNTFGAYTSYAKIRRLVFPVRKLGIFSKMFLCMVNMRPVGKLVIRLSAQVPSLRKDHMLSISSPKIGHF